MQTANKTFAFKLAEKRPGNSKWKARDGVSVAGCTHVGDGHYWYSAQFNPDGLFEC